MIPPEKDMTPFGVMTKPCGIKGELYVHLYNPDTGVDLKNQEVSLELLDGRKKAVRVTVWRRVGRRVVIGFKGCETRDQADQYRNVSVSIPRSAFAATQEDEFYDIDLISLSVVLPSGEKIGTVVGVEHSTAQELLVIHLEDGSYIDVPFVGELIRDVDIGAKKIVVDVPDGLPRRRWR